MANFHVYNQCPVEKMLISKFTMVQWFFIGTKKYWKKKIFEILAIFDQNVCYIDCLQYWKSKKYNCTDIGMKLEKYTHRHCNTCDYFKYPENDPVEEIDVLLDWFKMLNSFCRTKNWTLLKFF